jgi:hypothetical protein
VSENAGPTPFPVDPAVLGRIRPMQYRDAERVAELHALAMGNSLWTSLGRRFLQLLYRGLVESPFFLGFVYEEEGRVRGFIAGSTDTRRMYDQVLNRRLPAFIFVTGLGILRRPGLLPQLVRTAAYFDASGADIPGESMFCSFEPELRGRRISGHINKVLFDELAARGHSRVKITTEVDNEASNRQLLSWGFEEDLRFRFYGKDMVRWVLDLEHSPRVEPKSRHPAV